MDEDIYNTNLNSNKEADELWNGLEFEDAIPAQYEEKYGGYTNELIKQLTQLSALRMSSGDFDFSFNTKNKKLNDFLDDRFNDIWSEIDLASIAFILESDLPLIANQVLAYTKLKNTSFDVFVPTTTITQISPTGKLEFLQLIRYIKGGDLINISSEIRTLKDTTFSFHQYENLGSAESDVKEVSKDPSKRLTGTSKNASEINDTFNDKDFKPIPNTKGWISAVYFQNLPTKDQRGKPDFNPNSKYKIMLDKIYVRLHWELDFNKSKFIQDFEAGSNMFAQQWQGQQGRQQVENNFTYRTNNFMSPMSNMSSSAQYFETSNQNLLSLLQLFNYFLKKWWEEGGQHQSGSDVGKQISDFQEENERSAENLRFSNKVLRRKHGWRELIWRMILEMDDKILGKHGDAPKGMKRSDIIVNLEYVKTEIESQVIKNEILKLQYNLSDLETSMKKVQKIPQGVNVSDFVDNIFDNNMARIKTELMQKPVDTSEPNITNPQGKSNNQKKGFMDQLKKDKK